MIGIPDEIDELIEKYIKKFGKNPEPFHFEETNFDEYKKYLKKELKNNG